MSDRRPLSKGISNNPVVDKELAHAFVRGDATSRPAKDPTNAPSATSTTQRAKVYRVPFSTRVRSDFVDALKRASLQRQLDGVEPHSVNYMLEEAIEPWLREHGYLE